MSDRNKNLRKSNSKASKRRQQKSTIDERIDQLELDIEKLAREIYTYKEETRNVFKKRDDTIIISDSDSDVEIQDN
ncbi:hypothetical protein ACLKA7_015035 [Drosophila subpalustris]